MVYPSGFALITIEGHHGANGTTVSDIWRCTFKVNGVPPGSDAIVPSELSGYLTAIASAVSTFHGTTGLAGNSSFLTGLSAAVVGPDGKYTGAGGQETTHYTYPAPVAGGGTTVHPFSTALCLTLRTELARGYASRGRLYYPGTGCAIATSDGRITTSTQTSIATAAKTLFDALNTSATSIFGANHFVVVMSKVGAGKQGTVMRVEVGRKLDSQERREGALSESYAGNDLSVAVGLRERILRDQDELVRPGTR